MRSILLRLIRGLGWFLVASSAICLTASAVSGILTWRFVASATRARGTVIKVVERQSPDSGTMFHPVVRFRDSVGKEHEIFSSVGAYPPSYSAGEPVTMIYAKARPEEAIIDGFWYVWLVPAVLGIIGFSHAVVAAVLLALDKWLRSRRKATPGVQDTKWE